VYNYYNLRKGGVVVDIKYKRVLLKLSGEALSKGSDSILNYDILRNICLKIKECIEMGAAFGIVVGAGNIWRGYGKDMDRVRADHMGMTATVINSIALAEVLESMSVQTRVMTAIEMRQIAEPYIRNKAMSHLSKGRVCIFACGTGSPFVTTDTAAVFRAKEINADIVLLAKNNADAVYSADPNKFPDAIKLTNLNYESIIINNNLGVMDKTAASFSMSNDMPILVIGIDDPENIVRAVKGENIGTIINSDKN
jgi:uridylate kinase